MLFRSGSSVGTSHALRHLAGLVVGLAAGCGADTTQLEVKVRETPTPTGGGLTPPVAPPGPEGLCDTVECCESQLGAGASACVSVELVQGHCALRLAPEGTSCGTAAACGVAGSCSQGLCQVPPGTPVDCAGLDGPCTTGECDPEAGGCVARPRTATPCNDGDACTLDDSCGAEGLCAGKAFGCEDGDPCTPDSCDPAKGCVSGPSTCTECTTDADCPETSPCVGKLTCAEGTCQLIPDSGACALLAAPPCQTLTCNEETGACDAVPADEGAACDDGDDCTGGDVCNSSTCVGVPLDCDDKNACTADSCTPADGCVAAPLSGGTCEDGDACITDSACAGGVCTGPKLACDDADPCTVDICDSATGCVYEAGGSASCDDGDPCTTEDTCSAGACAGTAIFCGCDTDAECPDDGDLCNGVSVCGSDGKCTIDPATVVACPDDVAVGDCEALICDPSTGHCSVGPLPAGTACTDGAPCTTGDICGPDGCVGALVVCDDANACTNDSCDPASGCVYVDGTQACDDGDACTTGEACAGGACIGGSGVVCEDNELCTADTCSKKSGCKYSPIAGACDDGTLCTTGDGCISGKCVGKAKVCEGGSGCTPTACAPSTGECVSTPKDCGDDNDCTDDACADGECTYATVVCADGDACTTDSCDPATGCKTAPLPCVDGDACTADSCVGGQCVHAPIVCTDDDPCTDDACENGACVYPPVDCDDGDLCTTDECLPDGSCGSTPTLCDDGVDCTADSCVGGACVFTATDALCDDDNPCTTDTCSGLDDCLNPPNTSACEDGDACTTGDVCKAGVCTATQYTCGTCVGKAQGQSCDDGDGDTIADMCLNGWCRGFEKHLIAGPAGGAFSIEDVSKANGEYVALVSESVTANNATVTKSSVATISLDGDLEVVHDTTQTSATYKALTDGLAVGSSLATAELTADVWGTSGWLHAALEALAVPEVTSASLDAVWRDPSSGIAFVAGKGKNADSKDRSWTARCASNTCALETFAYQKFSEVETPRALTGLGGNSPLAILATDYASAGGTKFFCDAFRRVGQAAGTKWDVENFDTTAADGRGNDIHAHSATNALWVGSAGFVRSRAVDSAGKATWSKLPSLWLLQTQSTLTGAWTDAEITLATDTATVLSSTVDLVLVTHPSATSASVAGNWRRLSFGVAAPIDAPCIGSICSPFGTVSARLEDVWSDGETIVVVGWQVPKGSSTKQALLLIRRIL